MWPRAAILGVIAALTLLTTSVDVKATKPFNPTFDLVDVSPPTLGTAAHGDVYRRLQLAAGDHLPAIETLSVPANWDIANVTDNEIVGTLSLSMNQGACPGTPAVFGASILDKPTEDIGEKARWKAFIDSVGLVFDFVITGSAATGHTIQTFMFVDPTIAGAFCTPMDLSISHLGRSSPANQVVLTNPTTQAMYTWQATYRPGPLPAPHPDVTVSDTVPIGPDVDPEAIYRDGGSTANQVDSGDTLLLGTAVHNGTVLIDFQANERHVDNGNGLYDSPEAIYLDNGSVPSQVDAGDTLLQGAAAPLGTPLISFQAGPSPPPERHVDANGDGLYSVGDFVADFADNCPAVPNPRPAPGLPQPDLDGDGIPGTQPPPGGTFGGDACDADIDGDKGLNTMEEHATTNKLLFCSIDTTPNNEDPDARLEDFNDDRAVTGFDLDAIAAVIGQNVPQQAPVRKDIAPDPAGDNAITGIDLDRIAGVIGTSC